MTENQVGFLYNVASKLSSNNDTLKKLKSYYLMRCREITKGYGLPVKQFSKRVRCPHCYSVWSRDSEVKLKPIKLSKSRRRKIRSRKQTDSCRSNFDEKIYEMHKNQMIQTCTFCSQTTTTVLTKPQREYNTSSSSKEIIPKSTTNQTKVVSKTLMNTKGSKRPTLKPEKQNHSTVNLYTNTFDIFSLKNEKNIISSTIKPPPKVIKNNKKRKDKFAGLCQKAVLASAKLKQQKEVTSKQSENKLNLFLKPSSG